MLTAAPPLHRTWMKLLSQYQVPQADAHLSTTGIRQNLSSGWVTRRAEKGHTAVGQKL